VGLILFSPKKSFMKSVILICTFYLLFFPEVLIAQSQETKNQNFEVGLEGMLFTSVGKNFYSFNVGGPSLQLRITNSFKAGVAAMPSFYVRDGKTGAKLAVGPRIDYKNLVFALPFFHFGTSETWIMTAGIGYKFHRKN
jgi:hypothetical protein